MMAARARWLERELRLRLMLPVLALLALAGLFGAFAAQELMDRVFDRWLLDAARSLADQVRFEDGRAVIELSPQAEALLTYDVVDINYYEVLQGERHVLGQLGVPAQGERQSSYRAGARAYSAHYQGREVRVAQVPVAGAGGEVSVMVAETLIKRQRAQNELLWTMSPLGILVLAAALVIGTTVRRTIGPLERIAAQWNERAHASLDAMPTDDLPRELQPFAIALNDLLGRIRSILERERQFAATVAHQLRTPLTGLRLGLARAAQAPDVASARAILQELGETSQRTARLVQQLLALSRVDAEAKADTRWAAVDLVAIACEVGEAYMDAAHQKKIEIELVSRASTTQVRGDADLLSEALGNLLDNAIRYTPAGGRVLISVGAAPTFVSAADSGPGIDPDERESVFDRFVRGRSSTGDGSGLGLAIVKEIAAAHGASVFLADSELGGVCFTIRFP